MRLTFAILAVLVAVGANAQTDDRAKVVVAGRAWGSFENVQTSGATGTAANVSPRFRVTNNSSYVRVRGEYKLTDDLTTWGQIESQFALDGVNGSGLPFDSGRNTGVGITSATYGTLMIGRWDSPMKISTVDIDPWGLTGVNSMQNVIGQLSGQGNLYDARLGNALQYWSPKYQGIQARVGWVVNEERTDKVNPFALSAAVIYDGPVYVTVAYDYRQQCKNPDKQSSPQCTGGVLTSNAFPAVTTDTALRIGAMYTYKPTFTRVGAIFEMLKGSADAPAPVTDYTRNAYYVSLVQGIGNQTHEIAAAFGLADKFDTTPATAAPNDKNGAMFYTVAYRYNMSKSTMLWIAYTAIANDDAAAYDFGSKGIGGVTAGADPQALNGGVRFVF